MALPLPPPRHRVRLFGDPDDAQRYIGDAYNLLQQVRSICSSSGVPVFSMTRPLADGAKVRAGVYGQQHFIECYPPEYDAESGIDPPVKPSATPVRGFVGINYDHDVVGFVIYPKDWAEDAVEEGFADAGILPEGWEFQYMQMGGDGGVGDSLPMIVRQNAAYLHYEHDWPARIASKKWLDEAYIDVADWLGSSGEHIAFGRDRVTRFSFGVGSPINGTYISVLLGGVPIIRWKRSPDYPGKMSHHEVMGVTADRDNFILLAATDARIAPGNIQSYMMHQYGGSPELSAYVIPRKKLPVVLDDDNKQDYLAGSVNMMPAGSTTDKVLYVTAVPHPEEPRFCVVSRSVVDDGPVQVNRNRVIHHSTGGNDTLFYISPPSNTLPAEEYRAANGNSTHWSKVVELSVSPHDGITVEFEKDYAFQTGDSDQAPPTVIESSLETTQHTNIGFNAVVVDYDRRIVAVADEYENTRSSGKQLFSAGYWQDQFYVWEVETTKTVHRPAYQSDLLVQFRERWERDVAPNPFELVEIQYLDVIFSGGGKPTSISRESILTSLVGPSVPTEISTLENNLYEAFEIQSAVPNAMSEDGVTIAAPAYNCGVWFARITDDYAFDDQNPTDYPSPHEYVRGLQPDPLYPSADHLAVNPALAAEFYPRGNNTVSTTWVSHTISTTQGELGDPEITNHVYTNTKSSVSDQDGLLTTRNVLLYEPGERSGVWRQISLDSTEYRYYIDPPLLPPRMGFSQWMNDHRSSENPNKREAALFPDPATRSALHMNYGNYSAEENDNAAGVWIDTGEDLIKTPMVSEGEWTDSWWWVGHKI